MFSNLYIALYLYTVYNEWMSVCLGELRILSLTPRPDNMDGAQSYESSTVFGPLVEIVAISL